MENGKKSTRTYKKLSFPEIDVSKNVKFDMTSKKTTKLTNHARKYF